MSTRWSPFVKQLVVIALLIAGVWLVARVQAVLAPLVLALLLAYIVSQPAEWIIRRTGWPRVPVILATQLVVLLILLTVPAIVAPGLVSAFTVFGNTFVSVIQELLEATPRPIMISPSLTIDLGTFYEPINQWLRSLVGPDIRTIQNLQGLLRPFASGAAVVVRGAVSGIVWALFIFVVSFYVALDGGRLGRSVAADVPAAWRPELTRLWQELVKIWDAFVRGQFLLGALMGIIVWLVMTILGVRSAPALGLISAFLEFVPAIGPVLAAVPGVLIALILGSTWLPLPSLWFAVVVALTYFALQQIENLYLLPRVVGSRVRLHPAVVIVGALAGAQLAGVLGILLAAPVIAASRVLLGYIFRKLFDQPTFPEIAPPPRREQLWSELVRQRPVRAVLFDLDGTLIETDDHMVQVWAQRFRFLGRLLSEDRRSALARRILMSLEVFVNGALVLADRLHLDSVLFRLGDWPRRLRGIRRADDFVAVAGALDAVRLLHRRQYAVGLVTSRDRAETQRFLAQFGLADLFGAVITRDDVQRLKPHPMPVRMAAEKLGVKPAECVMVGDTNVDTRSAKAAGALAVGVLCGFGEPGDFGEADLVVDSPAKLGDWL